MLLSLVMCLISTKESGFHDRTEALKLYLLLKIKTLVFVMHILLPGTALEVCILLVCRRVSIKKGGNPANAVTWDCCQRQILSLPYVSSDHGHAYCHHLYQSKIILWCRHPKDSQYPNTKILHTVDYTLLLTKCKM